MEHTNKLMEIAKKEGGIDKETLEYFIAYCLLRLHRILQKKCGSSLDMKSTVFHAGWPSYDESAMKDDEIEVPYRLTERQELLSVFLPMHQKMRQSPPEKKR